MESRAQWEMRVFVINSLKNLELLKELTGAMKRLLPSKRRQGLNSFTSPGALPKGQTPGGSTSSALGPGCEGSGGARTRGQSLQLSSSAS